MQVFKMNIIKLFFAFSIFVLSGFASAEQIDKNLITVSGSAEIDVVPDEVHVSMMIQKDGTVLAEAQQQNDEIVSKILRILENVLRIDEKDIQTNFIDVRPVYEYPRCGNVRCTTPEFVRFETKKGIFVKLKNIDNLQALLEKSSSSDLVVLQ